MIRALHNQHSNVRLLFESRHLLVVDKPPGLSFHSEFEPGLLSTVRNMQNEGILGYQGDLHSVHRLDKMTSGICVFGKSKEAAVALSGAFATNSVVKYYVGLSDRRSTKKMVTV